MSINTSKTLQRVSAVLAAKCADTEKNMQKLMRDAGCPGAKMVKVAIPAAPGSRDDVVFASLNGAAFYFLRGKTVQMPEPVAEILRHAHVIA